MPLPDNQGPQAKIRSFRSPAQNWEAVASAATMTGSASIPRILSGNINVVKTVIDSVRNSGLPAWGDIPVNASGGKDLFERSLVVHSNRFWLCIAATDVDPVADTEPGTASGATYWTEQVFDVAPGADVGKGAAKVLIQNVGTNPIVICEGGGIPVDGAYHPPVLAAGAANDDGTGAFAQWDDFKGTIRITSISGAWRAAVKILWRNNPIN